LLLLSVGRYENQSLGILESQADGLGVWSLPECTLSGIVTNATFPSFLRLCQ
jgi:hypothetical protein